MNNITSANTILLLFFIFLTISCNSEQDGFTNKILGKWFLRGNTNTSYEFLPSGILLYEKEGNKRSGIWRQKPKGVECCYEGECFFFHTSLVGDTLYWNSSFLVSERATPNILPALAGSWQEMGVPLQFALRLKFIDDGTLLQKTPGEETRQNNWYVLHENLIIDEDNTAPFSVKKDTLWWENKRFVKITAMPDEVIQQYQLFGRWMYKKGKEKYAVLFFPEGTYGIEQTDMKGKWQQKGTGKKLRLTGALNEDFLPSANYFKLIGEEGVMTRIVLPSEGRWHFYKEADFVFAEDRLEGEKKVVAQDIRTAKVEEKYTILSSMGSRVSLLMERRKSGNSSEQYGQFITFDGQTGEQLSLTDLFPEEKVMQVLLRTSLVAEKWDASDKPVNLDELISRVKGDCNKILGRSLIESFAFLDLEGDKMLLLGAYPNICTEENTPFAQVLYVFNYADYYN